MSNKRRQAKENLFANVDTTPESLGESIYGAFKDVDRHIVNVDDDGAIQFGNFVMARTGLEVRGDITLDDWLDFGARLSQLKDSIQWILGDWANLGWARVDEWMRGEDGDSESKYKLLLERTDYAYGSLRNFASIAGRVPVSRRRDTLSFSHHVEIARFDDADEQEHWLRRAEEESLSVRQLRDLISPPQLPTEADMFHEKLEDFGRKQRQFANKIQPHQRQQMADFLRNLADEISP